MRKIMIKNTLTWVWVIHRNTLILWMLK